MKKTKMGLILPVIIFCTFFALLIIYASITAPPKTNESANATISTLANEDDYEWFRESTENEEKKEIVLKPRIIEREPTEQEKTAYREADNTWDSNNILQHIKAFEAYIKKYPNSPLCDDALILIGSSYDRLSECNKALEKFKKVKELYPNSNSVPLSLYETAHIYFYRFSDYDNAKLYYTQFIEEATEGERHSVWLKRSISMLEKWDEEVNKWEETKAKESSSSSTESDNTKLPTTSESDVSLNLYQSGDYLIVSGRVENARSYKRTLYIYVTDTVGSKHFVDAIYAKSYEKGTVKSTIKTSKAGPPPYRIFYEWKD